MRTGKILIFMVTKLTLFLAALLIGTNSYSQISDGEFLSRQMRRIYDCYDKQIDLAVRQKLNDISYIYSNCYGLVAIYDEFIIIGKSPSFRYEYMSSQRSRWYKHILSRIDEYKKTLAQTEEKSPTDNVRSSRYFYAQLRTQLKVLDVSFQYCSFGSANEAVYRDMLRKYITVLNFLKDVMTLEIRLKYANEIERSTLESALDSFSEIVNTALVELFTGSKKDSMCEKVKNQMIGKDKQIIDLVTLTLNAIDPNVKEIPKIKEATKKVEDYLEHLLQTFEKSNV